MYRKKLKLKDNIFGNNLKMEIAPVKIRVSAWHGPNTMEETKISVDDRIAIRSTTIRNTIE